MTREDIVLIMIQFLVGKNNVQLADLLLPADRIAMAIESNKENIANEVLGRRGLPTLDELDRGK